ncbi:hypothetical protein F5Y17DRAFT_456523 [Xylariaceae sp. FL0594]|nr:hypothetical protein F5Y17DRAFT_456523 [Xylariaceae sp. FL0594]
MSSLRIDVPGAYPETPLEEEPNQQPDQYQEQPTTSGLQDDASRQEQTPYSAATLEGDGAASSPFNTTSARSTSQQQQGDISQAAPRSLANVPLYSDRDFGVSASHADENLKLPRADAGADPVGGSVLGSGLANDQFATQSSNSHYTYGDDKSASASAAVFPSPPLPKGAEGEVPEFGYERPSVSAANASNPVSVSASPFLSNATSDTTSKQRSPSTSNKFETGSSYGSNTFLSNIDAPKRSADSNTTNNNYRNLDKEMDGLNLNAHDQPPIADFTFSPPANMGSEERDTFQHLHQDQNRDQRDNKEPYWGDLTIGTGIYNGVTGHGSNESPQVRDRSASRDRYYQNGSGSNSALTSHGVYNGVTGLGSDESTRDRSAGRDQLHGIYNGVTGRGGSESARSRSASRSRYYLGNDSALNHGVYNGVTGHGSKESPIASTSQRLSAGSDDQHQSQAQNVNSIKGSNDELSHHQPHPHQRVFPLVTGKPGNTSAVSASSSFYSQKSEDGGAQTQNQNLHKSGPHESHFKEGLAGVGTGAVVGAGVAGGKSLHQKHESEVKDSGIKNNNSINVKKPKDEKEEKHTHERKGSSSSAGSGSGSSKLRALFHFGHHKDKDTNTNEHEKPKEHNKLQKDLPYRIRANTGDRADQQSTAYKRLSDGTPSGIVQSGDNAGNSSATQPEVQKYSTRTGLGAERPLVHGRGQVQDVKYNTLTDGTPSGIAQTGGTVAATGTHRVPGQHQAGQQPQHRDDGYGRSKRGSTGSAGTASSQKSVVYNILSSGTPSGINLEAMQAQSQSHSHSSSS